MSEKKWRAARAYSRELLKNPDAPLSMRTRKEPRIRGRDDGFVYLHTHGPSMRTIQRRRKAKKPTT